MDQTKSLTNRVVADIEGDFLVKWIRIFDVLQTLEAFELYKTRFVPNRVAADMEEAEDFIFW